MAASLPVRARLRPLLALLAVIFTLLACPMALGSGPRWVTGPPFFNNSGNPVVWYTSNLQYFTDPGALSPSVDHAAADALVARAAGVWNIPTASITLSQGGTLDQHISSANVAVGSTGLTFPADTQPVQYQNKPIAVIYDADGSVTDLLLGAGASDPTGCRQNGVTEDVDSFSPAGQILHALVIINGRCSGPDPDQQNQLQYQLMRAFGRVLGVAWSQTNDNVFTGTPTPTPDQVANWPVMHPIDIVCGPYTYKCMQNPFQLRPDDIASLALLYQIWGAPAGKQDTFGRAFWAYGTLTLGNGQGMEEVNVTVRRWHALWTDPEGWQEVSGVTGYSFRRQGRTILSAPDGSVTSSIGSEDPGSEPFYLLAGIPVGDFEDWETILLETEAINPLYTGEFAIAPYSGNTIAPSGDPVPLRSDLAQPRYGSQNVLSRAHAATQCDPGPAGTTAAPAAVPAGGWWNGGLCSYGASGWFSLPIRDGRTLTLEVTALDEGGNVTMNKAMPVLGAWRSTDDPAVAPTLGAAPAAFNSLVAGMTTLAVHNAPAGSLRLALQDERGAGRPDFRYSARLLYADTISPANLPTTGGAATINGMGFRSGMTVLVHGVSVPVTRITPSQITVNVPSLRALGLSRAGVVDVAVADPSTGGSSTMASALGIASSTERLQVLSVPSGNVAVGIPASTPFSVQVVGSDGVTPVAGESVTFSVTGGQALWSGCAAATCAAVTDLQGRAAMTVTPLAAAALNLTVATPSVTLGAYRVTATMGPDRLQLVSAPLGTQTTGWPTAANLAVRLTAGDGVTPRAGQAVTFSSAGSAVLFSACGAAFCSLTTDSSGLASTGVTLLTAGTAVLTAAAGQATTAVTLVSAPPSIRLVSAPSGAATLGFVAGAPFKVQVLAGDGATPMAGESVVLMANGGGISWSACPAPACTLLTDSSGFVASNLTPSALGTVGITAAAREGVVTAAFTVGSPILRATATPVGTVPVGTPAASAFTVQLLQANGVTPISGTPVVFSLAAGLAGWSPCAALPCTLLTDSTGAVTGRITPLSDGAVTLVAAAAGSVVPASITGTTAPNILESAGTPEPTIAQGDTSTQPFAVRVLTGDHRSGVAGQPVVFAVDNGAVLAACGAPVCTVLTDATGIAAVRVTGLLPGTVHLSAASPAGTLADVLTVLPRIRSLSLMQPQIYVAEGTSIAWSAALAVADSAATVEGIAIHWSANGFGLHFAAGTSVVAGGQSNVAVTTEPLGAGVVASGTACAWSSLCAPLRAIGVSAAALQLAVVDGQEQTMGPAGSFAPVHLRVLDGAAHPVAGALVTVRQTVTATGSGCSETGRCGDGAVLHASAVSLRSDTEGTLTITPDTLPGTASVISLAASTGTTGFAAITLTRLP